MDEELSPSFSSSRVTCTCSAPSTKAEIPRAPGVPGSVRAKSSRVSEKLAFVIHCFWPEITHSSASRVAAQRRFDASEPTSGSERAKAPMVSPLASRGTNRDFCSSVPQARIGSVVALVCTATVTPTPASARDSCSSTRMYERKSAPAPPYSSGTQTPINPTCASLAKTSCGKRCSRSQSAACGAISASATSRASAWISCCSAVRSKFIVRSRRSRGRSCGRAGRRRRAPAAAGTARTCRPAAPRAAPP